MSSDGCQDLGSIQSQFGVASATIQNRFGVNPAPFRVDSKSIWGPFEIHLGLIQGGVGAHTGSLCGTHSGLIRMIDSGSVRVNSGSIQACFVPLHSVSISFVIQAFQEVTGRRR